MVKSGFTLIEMLVVVVVITILTGAGLAGANAVRSAMRNRSADALVQALTAAIVSYQQRSYVVPMGTAAQPRFKTFVPLFDLNRNEEIDGSPAVIADADHEGGFDGDVIVAGYPGAIATLRLPIPSQQVNSRRQPIDPWGNPLRIRFHANNYGTRGFQIWSCGRDGISGTRDDIPRTENP